LHFCLLQEEEVSDLRLHIAKVMARTGLCFIRVFSLTSLPADKVAASQDEEVANENGYAPCGRKRFAVQGFEYLG
jgi:hypothetical protein